MSGRRKLSLAGLVLLMVTSGLVHLRKPEIYVPIVPRFLGNAEFWVFWSGVLELAAGALLLLPRARRRAALLTIAIFVGVFPANVQMALEGGRPGGGWFAGSTTMLWLRLPLQLLLIWWAWSFARRSGAAGECA
jgi:uncharacterized membrane protein